MERTYSQNVARAFEIADYILLIPAILGAVLATLIPSFFTLLVYGFFIVGVILLTGYYKHSRGKLDERYFSALWITTAVYNFVLLLPCLYWGSLLLQTGFSRDSDGGGKVFFIMILPILAGYLTAVLLAIKAFSFEKRKTFYQRNQLLKTFDKIEIS